METVSIRDQEEKLFSRWKKIWKKEKDGSDVLFIADGVVDETEYLSKDPKLLFILKEVNGDDEGREWDLRSFIEGGGRQRLYDPTWSNIARWTEGIRNISQDIAWENLSDFTVERRQSVLKSIAAINLKKSPGRYTSDGAEIAQAAAQDKAFLAEQISIYNPDITICCGTASIYDWLILKSAVPWRHTSRGIRYCEPQTNKFIIDYVHPAARVQDCLKYYGLVDAVREIAQTTKP